MNKDDQAINDFVDYLSSIKNYSENTILSYKSDIIEFRDFLKETEYADGLLELDDKTPAKYYLDYLCESDLKETSIHRKISSLNAFYSYLVNDEQVEDNFFEAMSDIPKIPKRIVDTVSVGEISNLKEVCDKSNKLGHRNYCIVTCLFNCGLRVSELCNMQIKDIDFNERIIRVRGKGSKDRDVLFPSDFGCELKSYLSTSRLELLYNSKDENNRYVFLNKNGTQLTRVGVRKILEHLVELCGEAYHISPHMLRHAYATALINNGMNLRMVQELLGHSSLSTTQIYTHVAYENLVQTYAQAFPRAKKETKK